MTREHKNKHIKSKESVSLAVCWHKTNQNKGLSKKFRQLYSLGLYYSDAEMLVCLCNFKQQHSLTPICGSIHKLCSSCASSKVFLNALSVMFLILCWLVLVHIKDWQRELRIFPVNHNMKHYYYSLLREKKAIMFCLCLCARLFIALANDEPVVEFKMRLKESNYCMDIYNWLTIGEHPI